MSAVRVTEHGDPDALSTAEEAVPHPSEGEVRIDVRAAGVNFADVEKRRGNYPDGPTPPYRPGLEVAGVVESTGSEVDLAVGERVTALVSQGGYAEKAVAPADATIPVPADLSFPAAASLPVQFLTAHNTLFEWGNLTASERVLVTAAAGGVGTAAVQFADATDATVVGAASTETKREFVRRRGADRAIDYDDIETSVRDVDLVLDGVGGRVFTDAVEALAPGGRVVSFGMASGRVPTVATPRLFFQNKSVLGYHLEEALKRNPDRALSAVLDVVEAVADGDVEPVVEETFPLEAATRAHKRLQERESVGKLILHP
ncbi:zinc-binding alcohol dehydrogenase family protein [Halorubrum pallidum]|uniref:Zinc-binding alcohol dehydrogenase family protein n=1 Tax=Halorubrum pallidum TaxID=1526114 RepID=A0ABD5T4A5_9EURY